MTTNGGPARSAARERLAIAVPAYGRAGAVASSLAAMAEEARTGGLNVGFYVSDDTPDGSVEEVVLALAGAGWPVRYRRNVPALGHDRNLVATLLWPDADYVWLLGSALRVKGGQMSRVLAFLEDQDLLLVNSHSDDRRMIPARRGDDARALLRDALWHQTLTGASIYHRRVREWVRGQGDALVVVPDFPQISMMMGYAGTHDAAIGWFGERSIDTIVRDQSYWLVRAVDVFVNNWAAAVAAFPAIVPPDQRARVIGEHSARMNLFKATTLMNLRASGQFRWASLGQRRFRQAMHLPLWQLVALLALPRPVLAAVRAAMVRRRG